MKPLKEANEDELAQYEGIELSGKSFGADAAKPMAEQLRRIADAKYTRLKRVDFSDVIAGLFEANFDLFL